MAWRTLEGVDIEDVYEAIKEENEKVSKDGGQVYA